MSFLQSIFLWNCLPWMVIGLSIFIELNGFPYLVSYIFCLPVFKTSLLWVFDKGFLISLCHTFVPKLDVHLISHKPWKSINYARFALLCIMFHCWDIHDFHRLHSPMILWPLIPPIPLDHFTQPSQTNKTLNFTTSLKSTV